MASGFFALLDDIASLMDDVASMSKVAGKKTAGILGDDLAVNAEKASGFVSFREIPVLWAITKGSLLNKLIILPAVFLLSAYLPKAITVILIIGGLYLAYEGAEKVWHYLFHRHEKKEVKGKGKVLSKKEVLDLEKKKIRSAIVTDFILSVEIIIIALSTVLDQPLEIQIGVVTVIAIIATVGVYGIVALIVRMDDFGYRLINLNGEDDSFSDKAGRFLVNALPKVIRGLEVIGTLALLLVSGGIFVHNIHAIHDALHFMPSLLAEFLSGLVIGLLVLFVIMGLKKLTGSKTEQV
jgi:predicted DNA repair protein MutK